jgi:hypothetical protein
MFPRTIPCSPLRACFYEQEYYEDEAEDMGKVKRLHAKVTLEMENTLADSEYTGCLKTKEWTPLEPGAVEHKYYCPYVGLVLIEELQGGPTVRVELTVVVLTCCTTSARRAPGMAQVISVLGMPVRTRLNMQPTLIAISCSSLAMAMMWHCGLPCQLLNIKLSCRELFMTHFYG